MGKKDIKVAIIHDWLVTEGGAERVLSRLVHLFPKADIFSLVDFLNEKERVNILLGKQSTTSFIQHLPLAKSYFRHYLPLFPLAIESLDLSGYDLILSSSWAFAKGVRKKTSQKHLCYCHTPIRYAWDMMEEYTADLSWPKRAIVQYVLQKIRQWDQASSQRVDRFLANSSFVANRITKYYGRESVVVYPPVEIEKFSFWPKKEEFYLTLSRLVPYKKTQIIVEAFNQMPDKKLIVIGDGPELKRLRAKAKSNVQIMGYQPEEIVVEYMQRAKAFVYAALEDFGIVMAEALCCGTPIIAYGQGGAKDIVESDSGLFFYSQTPQALIKAVQEFEGRIFDHQAISQRARERFDPTLFERRILQIVEEFYG